MEEDVDGGDEEVEEEQKWSVSERKECRVRVCVSLNASVYVQCTLCTISAPVPIQKTESRGAPLTHAVHSQIC